MRSASGAFHDRRPENPRRVAAEFGGRQPAVPADQPLLRRRFVPQSSRFALLKEHVVVERDRLDNLAARYIGDPEQYWRLCDANNAIRPDELIETPGHRLRITLPEGIPAPSGGR
jgi:hypothetical protein